MGVFFRFVIVWAYWVGLVLLLGIAVFAPRARHFFSAAKKSTQKRPSLRLAPRKKHGVPTKMLSISCCEKTRNKTLKQFSQKTHDNDNISVAWLMRGKFKNKN